MCGITGFIEPAGSAGDALPMLRKMTATLRHRGPDSDGTWQSPDGRVNLGHQRLAVIDLTATGHQPMTDGAGNVLCYNGEIYNHAELRAQLASEGAVFRGTSDTEVLLHALSRWGVQRALERLNGMFAFAYWMATERKVVLARDRFGEKPLYYGWQRGRFLFASELKALAAHPGFEREIDRGALAAYLRFTYVPWPHCIFRGVRKLPPGHLVEADLSGRERPSRPYWQLRDLVQTRSMDPRPPDDPGLIDDLDRLLTTAVGKRMLADVPVGAFLSGGIDSSTVVALMQKQSTRRVKTFTIGFAESSHDESAHAAEVARHLGTEHQEERIDAATCLGVIDRLSEIYDEPFGDSSQIPSTLISQFTRQHVTVALTGDAGDELFGGYNRYTWGPHFSTATRLLPGPLRTLLGRGLLGVSPEFWNSAAGLGNRVLPRRLRVRTAGDKVHKVGTTLAAKDDDALYRGFVSNWTDPTQVVEGAVEATSLLDEPQAWPADLGFIEKMMFLDQMTYLPSDILTKVDRASMSCSLETRVPLLDNDVVAFAWSLTPAVKIRAGLGKWPLRQVLQRYVPPSMFDRPKMGFTLPLAEWLRGPLRGWAEELLDERRLRADGFFNPTRVRAEWSRHLSGRRDVQSSLWPVLMFQAWKQTWLTRD